MIASPEHGIIIFDIGVVPQVRGEHSARDYVVRALEPLDGTTQLVGIGGKRASAEPALSVLCWEGG